MHASVSSGMPFAAVPLTLPLQPCAAPHLCPIPARHHWKGKLVRSTTHVLVQRQNLARSGALLHPCPAPPHPCPTPAPLHGGKVLARKTVQVTWTLPPTPPNSTPAPHLGGKVPAHHTVSVTRTLPPPGSHPCPALPTPAPQLPHT